MEKKENTKDKCPLCGEPLFSKKHNYAKCMSKLTERVFGQPGKIVIDPIDKKGE